MSQFILILNRFLLILSQRLVDEHARIKGPYTLVVRSRPDLLLPPGPPLNLTLVAMEISRAISAPIQPTPRAALNMAFGKNKTPRIARPTQVAIDKKNREVIRDVTQYWKKY